MDIETIVIILSQYISLMIALYLLYISVKLYYKAKNYQLLNDPLIDESNQIDVVLKHTMCIIIITILYMVIGVYWRYTSDYSILPLSHELGHNTFESIVLILLILPIRSYYSHINDRAKFKNQSLIYDLLNSQTDLLVCVNSEYYIIFANKAFLALFGISEKNLIHGFNILTIFYPDEEEFIKRRWDEIYKEPYRIQYDQKIDTPYGEKWYDWNVWCIFSNDTTKTGMALSGRDITQIKEKENQIIQKRNYLNEILEFSPDCIFRIDMDHIIKYANSTYKEMFCGDEDPIGKQTLVNEVHPDDVDIVKESNIHIKYPPHQHTTQYRLKTIDDEYRWFEVSRVGIQDDFGEVYQVQCTAKYIHDRVVTE